MREYELKPSFVKELYVFVGVAQVAQLHVVQELFQNEVDRFEELVGAHVHLYDVFCPMQVLVFSQTDFNLAVVKLFFALKIQHGKVRSFVSSWSVRFTLSG